MPVKDPSNAVIDALPGTRAGSGLLWPLRSVFPSWYSLMAMIWHLQRLVAPLSALMVVESSTAANAVYVLPGRCQIDGTALAWAGGDLTGLANNDTTYIWAYKSGSAVLINKAVDGTGWPGGLHIKLAEVTVTAGAITAIVDRRTEIWLRAD